MDSPQYLKTDSPTPPPGPCFKPYYKWIVLNTYIRTSLANRKPVF